MSKTQSITINVPLELTPPDSGEYDVDGEWCSTRATFEGAVVDGAAKILADRAEKALKAKLDRVIDIKVNEIVERIVEAHVEKALEEGWQKHTQWGSPEGKPVTLKERIMQILDEQVRQSDFNRTTKTRAQLAITKAVESCFDKHLQTEVSKAQAELRKKLNGIVSNKFAETLKKSMGLK